MDIFVVFRTYRQVQGEYMATEVEGAFPTREAAEAHLKDKPGRWVETKQVPLDTGGSMPIEFLGVRAVHPTTLHGA